MSKTMKGWYFAAKDRRLRYGDNRIAKVGVTHGVKGKPKCCVHGLHFSKRALDALALAAGPVAFRVTGSGEMDHSDDKSAAQRRTYDAGGIDATNTLVEFACCAAMGAMLLAEHYDPRAWNAIEAALAWTRGEITDDDLQVYRNAACAAASRHADAVAYVAEAVIGDAREAAHAASYAVEAVAYVAPYAYDAVAVYDAKSELNDLLEQMLEESWTKS